MVLVDQVRLSTDDRVAAECRGGREALAADCEKRWFAVQTLPNRESKAAFQLKNQAFQAFLPVRRVTRRHARRIETVLRPFFPGYLFVALDVKRERWRSVNGTFGVSCLIMQGDMPAPIPNGVVEALLDACDGDGTVQWRQNLHVGQSVRIIDGPFTDFVGTLERLDDAARVRVLLEIMGGQVSTLLPVRSLVSLSSYL